MMTLIVGPATKRAIELTDKHTVTLASGERKLASTVKTGDLILGLGRVVETIRTR